MSTVFAVVRRKRWGPLSGQIWLPAALGPRMARPSPRRELTLYVKAICGFGNGAPSLHVLSYEPPAATLSFCGSPGVVPGAAPGGRLGSLMRVKHVLWMLMFACSVSFVSCPARPAGL